MDGGRNGGRNGDKEKDRDRDSDAATAAQSRRPPYVRCNTDSQVAHQRQQQPQQQKSKHQKRVVGGGAARFHARAPSTKALQKLHSQSTTKLKSRASSPEPERPLMYAQTHRRTASDLRPTSVVRDSPSPPNSNAEDPSLNLDLDNDPDLQSKKNHSNLNLSKRNRSHVDIGKRSKSAVNFKRSSSRDNTQKPKNGKGAKNQVHFDLGNDDGEEEVNEDEWVDASASASPYLSRRGSVVSTTGQSPAKPHSPSDNEHDNERGSEGDNKRDNERDNERPQSPEHQPSPTRPVAQRNDYITSRLLKRVPSHGAPPQMSTETVSVNPASGSPISQANKRPPSLYDTPKTSVSGTSGPEELISRFVSGSGPGSSGRGESGSFFVPPHAPEPAPVRRSEVVRGSKSLVNLTQTTRDPASDEEEDGSALVPRPTKQMHMPPPASQSRTQQKLNLQRASSSMEPAQTGPGVGVVGPSLIVGSNDYEHRDPRIGKLLERTGMEYLVVRRYQNPIARSIARLSQLPGATKSQHIPRLNGTGNIARDSLDLDGMGRLGSSQSMMHMTRSRPTTPRRSTSIRTLGPRSSYEGDDGGLHERLSGSTTGDTNDDELTTLLRNLWDKSTDLVASQD